MNALIPLQTQVVDFNQRFQEGQQAGRQNALTQALQQYGGAAAMGDQNALMQIAPYAPELVMGMRSDQQQMDLRGRADDRAERGFQADISAQNERMEMARQEAHQATEMHKAKMTAVERENTLKEIEMIGAFEGVKTPEEMRQRAEALGLPELADQFENLDALLGMAQGVRDALGENDLTEYQRQSLEIERERLEKGNRGSYGLNPIEGTVDGKPVYIQPGSAGDVNVMQFPEGFEPTPGFEKIDLGTEFVYRDKRTGEVLGREPKDVAGEASARAAGTTQGETVGTAQAQLGPVTQAFEEIDALVTDLLSDPSAVSSMTGASVGEGFGGLLPPITQGDRDFSAKLSSLGGRAFLGARQALKGGGAITDYEGQKAEDAYLRAQRAQSAEEFTAALNEFRTHMRRGLTILQQQSQGNVSGMAPMPSVQGAPEIPAEIMDQLRQSPPGTVIRGQNGEVLQWDGAKLNPL